MGHKRFVCLLALAVLAWLPSSIDGAPTVSAPTPTHSTASILRSLDSFSSLPDPNATSNRQQRVQAAAPVSVVCPAGTYIAHTVYPSANDPGHVKCQACPPGYICSEPNTQDYSAHPCPPGTFCPLGMLAVIPCPAGSYQPMTGAAALDECLPCPAGSVCPTAGSVTPTPCAMGKHCPGAAPVAAAGDESRLEVADGAGVVPAQCAPGHICVSPSAMPKPCLAGFFCGPVDAFEMTPCPTGTFCGARAAAPTPCPAGTRAVMPDEGLLDGGRVSEAVACAACPAGTYQQSGDGTGRCLPCAAGHVCTGAAHSAAPLTVDALGRGGYRCPAGYYCPQAARAPVACPAGTYQPMTGGASLEACTPCPVDTFSASSASLACSACGPLASAPRAGSASCECARLNRFFSPKDRSCRCLAGYATSVPAPAGSGLLGRAASTVKGWIGQQESQEGQEQLSEADAETAAAAGAAAASSALLAAAAAPVDESSLETQLRYDCAPVRYERCDTATQVRLAATGECVARADLPSLCAAHCGSTAEAVFDVSLGLCICKSDARVFETNCDAACRAQAPVLRFVPSHPLLTAQRIASVSAPVAPSPIAKDSAVAARLHGHLHPQLASQATTSDEEHEATAAHADQGTLLITLPDGGDLSAAKSITFTLPLALVGDAFRGSLTCPQTQEEVAEAAGIPASALSAFAGWAPVLRSRACPVHMAAMQTEGGIAPLFTLPSPLLNVARDLLRSSPPSAVDVPQLSVSRASAQRLASLLDAVAAMRASNAARASASAPAHASASSSSRSLLDAASVGSLPAVFCLKVGESMVWEIQPQISSYPVYQSSHALNSNPTFDYSAFTQIPLNYTISSPMTYALFGHTFDTAGTYVFMDNTQAPSSNAYQVVTVLASGQACPASTANTRASTISAASLAALGVGGGGGSSSSWAVAAPNWRLLGVLLALFVAVILFVLLALCCLQHTGWGTAKAREPVYRREARDNDLDVWSFTTKGSVTTLESRSQGTQPLEMDRDDLIEDAQRRGDKAALKKLRYKHKVADPSLGADEKRVMNELANAASFEELDFHSLYKTMEETGKKMREYFGKQGELLHLFYAKTEQDVDHLKALLSIKMHVQMQRSGEGFAEAVDRLVSGELLARQAFQELSVRWQKRIDGTLEAIKNKIMQITIDCNIFPIMQLLKECHELVHQSEQRLLQERARRKTFASHIEIVGKEIVEELIKSDKSDAEAQDDYWQALLYFDAQVQEVRTTMTARESAHHSSMEALTNEEDRKTDQMQYHRGMVELVRIIQGELLILEEQLKTGILKGMSARNEEAYDTWVRVQTTLLEKRLGQLRSPTEGRLFRGINPDLAKILTGLMGMVRSGLRVNPKTGCYEPKAPFDPSDPFQTISDPGDVYKEWYEQQLHLAVEKMRQEAEDAKREAEEEEARQRAALEEEDRRRQEEQENDIATQRAALEANQQLDERDAVLQQLQRDAGDQGNVRQVTDALDRDQRELLASLRAKRDAVAADPTLTEAQRQQQLAEWDRKLRTLEAVLKDEALTLITQMQVADGDSAQGGADGSASGAAAGSGASSSAAAAAAAGGAASGAPGGAGGAADGKSGPADYSADPDAAPSIREIELRAEMHAMHAELARMRASAEAMAAVVAAAEAVRQGQSAMDVLGGRQSLSPLAEGKGDDAAGAAGAVPEHVGEERELALAQQTLQQKQDAIDEFKQNNADKLPALESLLQKRRQQKLLGGLLALEDDDDASRLSAEELQLVRTTEMHEGELAEARNKLQNKVKEIQDRQEAKRKAIAEAEARERALKRELLEADEDGDLDAEGGLDESKLVERRRKFDETQKARRAAELARLDEEQKRQLAAVTDAEEIKRLQKEFEMDKLRLLRQLNSEDQAQKLEMDAAIKRRQEARKKKAAVAEDASMARTPGGSRPRRARGGAGADGDDDGSSGSGDAAGGADGSAEGGAAGAVSFEEDRTEEELEKMTAEARAAYLARKQQRDAAEAERVAKRKEARRKRLEQEEKSEAMARKNKHLERLARIHHDMELDAQEQALLEELEVETRALVSEATGLAGLEVWNTLAAHSRKVQVDQRIEVAKQQLEDAKEANDERTMLEAQRLLRTAAKEKDDMKLALESEMESQARALQEQLAARKRDRMATVRENKEKRRQQEQERLENAQRNAELSAGMALIQQVLERMPADQRAAEAKRVIEAEFQQRQAAEKRDMLAEQSAERKVFWKEELLKDGSADPDAVQREASAKFDAPHQEAMRGLEQRHLDEIREAYLQLFPGADVSGPEWAADQSRSVLEEYARKKQQMLEEEKRKRDDEYTRKKQELDDKEAKLEAENRRKLEELQSKKAADDAVYNSLLNQHEDQLQKSHQKLLERKQQLLDAQLAASTEQSDETRRRMIEQHRDEMARFEARLKEDYARQKQTMVRKLQARREQQQKRRAEEEKRRKREAADAAVAAKVDSDILPGAAAAGAAGGSSSSSAASAAAATPGMPVVAAALVAVGAKPPAPAPAPATSSARASIARVGGSVSHPAHGHAPPAGMTAEQWDEKLRLEREDRDRRQHEHELKAKALEQMSKSDADSAEIRARMAERLDRIESVAAKLEAEAAQYRASYYVDEKETSIRPMRPPQFDDADAASNMPYVVAMAPEPKALSALSAREFVLYRFAHALVRLLTEQGLVATPKRAQRGAGSDVLSLMIATGLPATSFKKTAFPNSYLYDVATNTLWVRHERLVDAGEFVLILLHALAHVHTMGDGDEWDDRAPLFLGHFYALLRVVASDMFFSRARGALHVVGEGQYADDNLAGTRALAAIGAGSSSAAAAAAGAGAAGGKSVPLKDLLEEADLWDTDESSSLLPTTRAPRVPKLEPFQLARVDFAEASRAPGAGAASLEPVVDDLIDIHVSLVDQAAHASNDALGGSGVAAAASAFTTSAPAVLASSNGMEYFSTRELMRRMDEYGAFTASTKLRGFLNAVERKAAGYDRTRERLGQLDFRGQGQPEVRANKLEVSNGLAVDAKGDFSHVTSGALTELSDDFNRQLMAVVDQLFESSTRLQRLQQRLQDPALSIAKRANVTERLANERVIMARLDRERLVLTQRIHHLERRDIPNQKAQQESAMDTRAFSAGATALRVAAGVEQAGVGEFEL